MPLFTSDGQQFEDQASMILGVPLESPTEPAGASKPKSGTTLPDSHATNSVGIPDGPDPAKGQQGALDKIFGLNGPREQLWPEKVVRSLWEGILAPGNALQGKLPMWAENPDGTINTSPEVIEKANDLASFAVLGPAPVAAKMADGTLGSFAGVKSKTFNSKRMSAAEEFERGGMSPDDIWTQTGMARGAEGKWRYEIPDNNSALKLDNLEHSTTTDYRKWWDSAGGIDTVSIPSKGNYKLSDILDHPELYKAYPQLADINIVPLPVELQGKAGGFYRHDTNTIAVQGNLRPDQLQATLLHESQHAIQNYENFARGGSPNASQLNYYKTIDKLKAEADTLVEKYSNVKADNIPQADVDRILYINRVLNLDTVRKRAGEDLARERYMRLAGEVEARNVEKRFYMNPKELKRTAPERTESRTREQQIPLPEATFATPYGYQSGYLDPPIPQ